MQIPKSHKRNIVLLEYVDKGMFRDAFDFVENFISVYLFLISQRSLSWILQSAIYSSYPRHLLTRQVLYILFSSHITVQVSPKHIARLLANLTAQ